MLQDFFDPGQQILEPREIHTARICPHNGLGEHDLAILGVIPVLLFGIEGL